VDRKMGGRTHLRLVVPAPEEVAVTTLQPMGVLTDPEPGLTTEMST
jgi:hypothetical protein